MQRTILGLKQKTSLEALSHLRSCDTYLTYLLYFPYLFITVLLMTEAVTDTLSLC